MAEFHHFSTRPALPSDVQRMASVNIESWRFAYKGIVPEKHFKKLTPRVCELYWRKTINQGNLHSLVLANGNNGEIVGVAAAGEPSRAFPYLVARRLAELHALYLLPNHTRAGLGGLLLGAVVERLESEGFDSLVASVIEGNPCSGFYPKKGAEIVGRTEEDMGGFNLVKIAYVWRDIRTLRPPRVKTDASSSTSNIQRSSG